MEYDYLFKILVLGNHYTGKTSILHKLTESIDLVNPGPTIGVDFKSTYYNDFLNRNIKLHFWDTGGHPDYDNIIKSYYKNTAAAIIVFDVTNHQSFFDVNFFLNNLASFSESNIKLPILLIGNKVDKKSKRIVSYQEASNYAEENNLFYIEIGKEDNDNYMEKFEKFFDSLTKHYIDNNIKHSGVYTKYKTISVSKDSRNCDNSRQKMDCCIPS